MAEPQSLWSRIFTILLDKKRIRTHVRLTLQGTSTYKSLRVSYKRRFCPEDPLRLNPKTDEKHEPPDRGGPVPKSNNPDDHWDWDGFPPRYQSILIIENITTVYLFYRALKSYLPSLLDWLLGLLFDIQAADVRGNQNLYRDAIVHPAASVYCLYNIFWRFNFDFLKKSNWQGLFGLLLMTDHDVEKFYRQFDQESRITIIEPDLDHRNSIVATKNYCIDNAERTDDNLLSPARLGYTAGNSNRSYDRMIEGTEERGPVSPKQSGNNEQRQHFFRSVMCYSVRGGRGETYYKLRPNRTKEECANLQYRFLVVHLFVSVTLTILGWMSFAFVYMLIKENGCNEAEASECRQPAPTNQEPRLSIGDIIDNAFLWFYSMTAQAMSWSVVYLINYDVLLYWKHLNERLVRTHQEVKAHSHLRRAIETKRFRLAQARATSSYITNDESEFAYDSWKGGIDRITTDTKEFRKRTRELEESIYELQAEFHDFFNELASADYFVSDAITSAILINLSFHTLAYYTLSDMQSETDPISTLRSYVVMVCSLIGLSIISFKLVEVHDKCIRSYVTLCSLMAIDTSRYKLNFMRVLEFYTVKHRHAYTLAQTYPFTMKTYLSIFGWSLSCILVLDSFRYRRVH